MFPPSKMGFCWDTLQFLNITPHSVIPYISKLSENKCATWYLSQICKILSAFQLLTVLSDFDRLLPFWKGFTKK